MRCQDADSYSQKWLKDVEGTIYRENNLEKLQKWVNSWVSCSFFCPKHPKTKPMIHNSVSRLQNINTWSTAQLSSSPCQGVPPKVWVAYGTAQWWAACSRHSQLDPTGSPPKIIVRWCPHDVPIKTYDFWWWLESDWNMLNMTFQKHLGMSSYQLTSSYFSEG